MSQRTRRRMMKGTERTWMGNGKGVDKGAAGDQKRGVTVTCHDTFTQGERG